MQSLSRFLFAAMWLVGSSGCSDDEKPQPTPCTDGCSCSEDWWKGGTWSAESTLTDFQLQCPPSQQTCPAEPETHGWTTLAAGLASGTQYAFKPSLQLDSCGQPILAWSETPPAGASVPYGTAIMVQRWAGEAWEAVGPQPATTLQGKDLVALSLALDPLGRPLVAASDGSESGLSLVAHDAPGSHGVASLASALPSDSRRIFAQAVKLVITPGGEPIVGVHRTSVYTTTGTQPTVTNNYDFFRFLPGGRTSLPTLVGSDPTSLRLDGTGALWLRKDQQLHRMENGAWTPVGPLLPGTYRDMQLTRDNRPVVLVYRPANNRMSLAVVGLGVDGQWTELMPTVLGTETISLGDEAQLRLAPETGRPFVAWSEGLGDTRAVRVSAWDGAAWRTLGDTDVGVTPTVYSLSLELDRNGHPTVAWNTVNGGGHWVARFRP